jgi:hypothetical protein
MIDTYYENHRSLRWVGSSLEDLSPVKEKPAISRNSMAGCHHSKGKGEYITDWNFVGGGLEPGDEPGPLKGELYEKLRVHISNS